MIAEILERYRIKEGISQKELAARLDTTQAAVSSWERGIRNPTPAFKKRIMELTGCDVAELMTKTAQQRPRA